MKLPVVDTTGSVLEELAVSDDVFGVEPNRSVLHQAYVAQLANRRASSASTKSRGQVRGSTRKLRRQNGFGSARVGSSRSPVRVGGGVAHGPTPRDHAKRFPIQMRRLAIRSALSSHAIGKSLRIVRDLSPEDPKTRFVAEVLKNLQADRGVLIVCDASDVHLRRAARNVAAVSVLSSENLNVADLVDAHDVLFTEDVVSKVEDLWGTENLKRSRTRAAAIASTKDAK